MNINTLKTLLSNSQVPTYLPAACQTVCPPVIDESGQPIDAKHIVQMGERMVRILGARDLKPLKNEGLTVYPLDESLNKRYFQLSANDLRETLTEKVALLLAMLPVAMGCVQHKTGETPVVKAVMIRDRLPADPTDPGKHPTRAIAYNSTRERIEITADKLVFLAAGLGINSIRNSKPASPDMLLPLPQNNFLALVEEAFHAIPSERAALPQHIEEVRLGIPHDQCTGEVLAVEFCRQLARDLGFIGPSITRNSQPGKRV